MGNYFSVPIFFVVFRETLEAAIIMSILLALAEQLVGTDIAKVIDQKAIQPILPQPDTDPALDLPAPSTGGDLPQPDPATTSAAADSEDDGTTKTAVEKSSPTSSLLNAQLSDTQLLKKLKFQIFAGAMTGLLIAFCIGAAFLAVFYVEVNNLWGASEELWEGIFSVLASALIWLMGLTMLRMDRAKIKWRIKLKRAFASKVVDGSDGKEVEKGSLTSRLTLFILPLVTVLREGLEAVVFVGGVSLGQPAASIPIAAIVGAVLGLAIGYAIYRSSSRLNLSLFLVVSTALLLLLGAGLLSKAVGDFERYNYNKLVGADVAELGDGPGSYRVGGNLWHLNCCNPENTSAYGWAVFNSVLGWTNNGT
ncbi:high-affinity iron permease, partial [Gonapodya sp. JEL0774]